MLSTCSSDSRGSSVSKLASKSYGKVMKGGGHMAVMLLRFPATAVRLIVIYIKGTFLFDMAEHGHFLS